MDREETKRHFHDFQQTFFSLLDDKEELVKTCTKQRKILDLCPGGRPDGTGIMTPESWIKWAKKELNYEDGREKEDGKDH